MPTYRYVCGKTPKKDRCKLSDLPEGFFDTDNKFEIALENNRLTVWSEDGTINSEESIIVQLVSHMMAETPEIKCPACDMKAVKIIGQVQSYFPGNCYLNKVDCKKHIMIDKLNNDDPYGHIRPEGDKEELIKKIKRGSKEPSKNFFPGGKGGLKASVPFRPGS